MVARRGSHCIRRRTQDSSAIYIVRSDGSLRRISASTGEYDLDFWPDISPDGSACTPPHATGKDSGPQHEIETSKLDGSDRRRLTDTRESDSSPAWSPDGAHIAFSSQRKIVVMGADGSDQRTILDSLDLISSLWIWTWKRGRKFLRHSLQGVPSGHQTGRCWRLSSVLGWRNYKTTAYWAY